jgi:hypothetical protein
MRFHMRARFLTTTCILAFGVSVAQMEATRPVSGIRLYETGERDYQALGIPEENRIHPEARNRVVIFKDGSLVADRGLEHTVRTVPRPGAPPWREEILEKVEIASDQQFAVIQRFRFRQIPEGERRASAVDDPSRRLAEVDLLSTELTWVDANYPDGFWSTVLGEDRWLSNMLLLPGRRGIAVSTTSGPNGPADLRLFDQVGREVLSLDPKLASVTKLDSTLDGSFFLVDLAYPQRGVAPDRGVRIFNMLDGTSWTYSWSYGEDGEPISYEMLETGALRLELPGEVHVYGPDGTLVEVKGSGS